MNISLGCRALLLLAFVGASTAVIIAPELLGGPAAAGLTTLDPTLAVSHP